MGKAGTALITGATGGMGKSFADALAARGHDLILTDRVKEPLEELAAGIATKHKVRVRGVVADLATRADLERVAQEIRQCGDFEILVNNAGFGIPGAFADSDLERTVEMIDVHVVASCWLCRTAVSGMIERRKGSIVNMASLAGFRPGRGDITYGATKRFLIHFSRSLQAEVEEHGINVQALCPGYTRTGFHDAADYSVVTRGVPRFLWMAPDDVVSRSLAALGRRKVVCIPGVRNKILRLLLHFPIVIRAIRAVARRLS